MHNIVLGILMQIFKTFILVYDFITFPLYYMLQKPWETLELSNQKKAIQCACDSTSWTWKSTTTPKEISKELSQNKIETIAHIIQFCQKKYGNRNCLGVRQLISEENEIQASGKSFAKSTFGTYHWKTMSDVNVESKHFGLGLRELGINKYDKVAIFAETRAEWMISALGSFKNSIAIVTIYTTLGDEAIIHAINETAVQLIITSYELIFKLKDVKDKLPNVKTIVYMEHQLNNLDVEDLKLNVKVLSYSNVLKLGESSNLSETFPQADTPAVIMYTSGSTGLPKGVILLHSNLLATMKSFSDCTNDMKFGEGDILIGFLPLAHIFEMVVECVCLCTGVSIGYSSTFTVIDTSTKIKAGTKGDATVLQPTIMTCVPLLLDRISKGIEKNVSDQGMFLAEIFKFSLKYKAYWINKGYRCPIMNNIILDKFKGILGGRVKFILCGGAPLAAETQEFFEMCLSVKIVQGYGLTETTSCATVSNIYDLSLGRVGGPTTLSKIKLENWDEGRYTIKNKPFPQGEVIVGGPAVTAGYYNLPDKTAEDYFKKDGIQWFRTGDIGEVHKDGVLKIIDRKKDLVKLQMGEYVSLGKVETELKTSALIDNICVIAHPEKNYCVALIQPNPKGLMEYARIKLNIQNTTFPEVCKLKKVQEAITAELLDYGTKRSLNKYEIPADVRLCDQPWTPDNNLVTAAFKIRRREIQAFYKKEIDEMYKL